MPTHDSVIFVLRMTEGLCTWCAENDKGKNSANNESVGDDQCLVDLPRLGHLLGFAGMLNQVTEQTVMSIMPLGT